MDDNARRVAVFPHFTYEEMGVFRLEVLAALQRHRRAWRIPRGEVPVADALEILDALPTPESRFEVWHLNLKDSLEEEASQWNQERNPGTTGRNAICGETLIEFYIWKLDKQFEPYKQRGKLMEYEALWQAGQSPLRYLGDIRQLERYIEKTHHKQAIAERFVDRLDDSIREGVLFQIEAKPKDQWYSMLNKIAEQAENIWMNRANDHIVKKLQTLHLQETSMSHDRSSGQTSSSGTDNLYQAHAATRAGSKHFYCNHHGPNHTHDTRDCLVLYGQQREYIHEQSSTRRGAMVSAGSQANSDRWEGHRQHAARPFRKTRSDRTRCSYCDRYGHSEDSCVILYLSLIHISEPTRRS